MKLIKINDYWIIVESKEVNINDYIVYGSNQYPPGFVGKITTKYIIQKPHPLAGAIQIAVNDEKEVWVENKSKVIIASQNPEHNLPTITFSDEVAEELGITEYMDFWENMPVKWTKWSKKEPWWNGSVYVQFNGKNQGNGIVHNGKLVKLSGLSSSEFDKYFDTFYWLDQQFDYQNQALSDNKDQLFTLEQLEKAIIDFATDCDFNEDLICYDGHIDGIRQYNEAKKWTKNYIQSLTKQEYECSGELQENTFLVTKIIKDENV